jgi:hypothetical protein
LGGRVGARVGGARCARGARVGWDERPGEGTGIGGWEIGEGERGRGPCLRLHNMHRPKSIGGHKMIQIYLLLATSGD